EADVEAALVVGGQRPPQAGDALADGVAVRTRVLHRLDQFRHDMRRGGAVGISHAEVDAVLPGAASLRLGRVDFGEDVGRQAADAMKLAGGLGTHDRPFGVEDETRIIDWFGVARSVCNYLSVCKYPIAAPAWKRRDRTL